MNNAGIARNEGTSKGHAWQTSDPAEAHRENPTQWSEVESCMGDEEGVRGKKNFSKLGRSTHVGTVEGQQTMYMEVGIEGQKVKIELDTEAAVSLIPYQLYQYLYQEKFTHLPIGKT